MKGIIVFLPFLLASSINANMRMGNPTILRANIDLNGRYENTDAAKKDAKALSDNFFPSRNTPMNPVTTEIIITDKNALYGGIKYAQQAGWNTPEKAILGGAQFIANNYIKSGQNTLYKMRFNPQNPGVHQYARA